MDGIEPPTLGSSKRCFYQLSYTCIIWQRYQESNPKLRRSRRVTVTLYLHGGQDDRGV